MNIETTEERRQRQLDLEQEALAMGATRYRGERMAWHDSDPTERGEAEMAPGKSLIQKNIVPVAEAIGLFLEEAMSGKAGRKHVALPYLAHADTSQAAYLALRNMVNSAATGSTLSLVGRRIGGALKDHLEMVAMSKEHPGLYRKVSRQLAKSTSTPHRLGVIRHIRDKYALTKLGWSPREQILVGTKLAELVMEALPGIFVLEQHTRGRNDRPVTVEFTKEATEWLEATHGRCELLSPIHLPMLVAPRKWHTPYAGGYLTDVLKPRFVRTRNRHYLDELGGVDLSDAMRAVNAIQETPWRVNRPVLDALLEEQDRGGGTAGLPRRFDLPLPPRPLGMPDDLPVSQMTAEQKESLTVWKAKAAKVYGANSKARHERITTAQKLYVARRFAEEERIYFPHFLDFRGRVYPFASYLNPQSDDVGRGLLQFAEGKPLGEGGAYWLAVHIAGLWGVDKVTFDERVAWVMEHEEEILDSALDPHDGQRFWVTAEKPFQALAACFEWLGYTYNGEAHVSHLPIAMDGSCSGLQHYSALLRDPVGGAAVNLVPAERPADIYTMVAKRAQALSDGSLGGTNDDMAKAWAGKVGRKVAKQPTMTLCYSATKYGMKGQIEAALGKLDEEGEEYLSAENHTAALYMAGVVWNALGDTVVAARAAMDWLQEVSVVLTEAEMPVRWTSPIGLPVMQAYTDMIESRLGVHVGGRRIQLTLKREGTRLSSRRQGSGIAPNFVHSLDAAHLLSTVNLGVENGLSSFAVIHDSFAVHACDTALLNGVLRESFVRQYEGPVLEEFREDLVSQLEAVRPDLVEKIPPLPETGTLDLSAVRESEFFFA